MRVNKCCRVFRVVAKHRKEMMEVMKRDSPWTRPHIFCWTEVPVNRNWLENRCVQPGGSIVMLARILSILIYGCSGKYPTETRFARSYKALHSPRSMFRWNQIQSGIFKEFLIFFARFMPNRAIIAECHLLLCCFYCRIQAHVHRNRRI